MRILVVDDDLAVCRSIDRALRLEGYEVETVSSGGEALEAMASNSPDALVLDLQLPDLDGLAVCRRIREFSDVPVVVLGGTYARLARIVIPTLQAELARRSLQPEPARVLASDQGDAAVVRGAAESVLAATQRDPDRLLA